MSDTPFDPGPMLEALARHKVKYVVVGGFAAIFHGAAHLTFDLDITPEQSRANLDRLSAALTDLGARVRTDAVDEGLPFSHSGESLGKGRVWNLQTDHGDLDLTIMPSGTEGYDDLVTDAAAATVLGVHVMVASLRDVIRSKEAADRPKDHLALPTLRRLLEAQEQRPTR
jgi:hypothetical protein